MADPKKVRKKVRRSSKGEAPNYLIVGPKGRVSGLPDVSVVSGKTGEIRPVPEDKVKELLKLVQDRRDLGKKITDRLKEAGIIVGPKGTIVHLEEEGDGGP